jgi:prepilin-type N-terminal cleavage/methylation domain-containing protein
MIFTPIKRRSILPQKGFTLLEILLIIAILAVAVSIVIIAINPGKQLGENRNSQRQADVRTIVDGVHQYSIDNDGLPPAITTTATEICATGSSSCAGLVDLTPVTSKEKYLISVPKDPQCSAVCVTNGTGYKIMKTTSGRVTVSAPASEESKNISVTR